MTDDAARARNPVDPPGIREGSAPVLPVSLFVSSARLLLERHLGLVWVAGEISGYTRAASGHIYFTLKDASAQVRCVFFRNKAQGLGFNLRDGLAVEARAVASIYEARGEFQLNVETLRLAGLGALYERFLQMKAALERAGWFDSARKRPLPAFPRRIGVVTSRHAAALRDVLTTLARRYPTAPVVLYPASVQGAGAAAEIAAAIRTANEHAYVDVLIVCRGGGSLEDLWAFNEETVARAVHESALPVVSGVGHETDFTICDFVADARAPTPTAAAALVAPDRAVLLETLARIAHRIARAYSHGTDNRAQRVDAAARRLVHPAARLVQQCTQVARLAERLARAFAERVERDTRRLAAGRARLLRELRAPLPQAVRLAGARAALHRAGGGRLAKASSDVERIARALTHLNPSAVLERGYAIVMRDGDGIVTDSGQIHVGEHVALTLAKGRAGATLTSVDGADSDPLRPAQ